MLWGFFYLICAVLAYLFHLEGPWALPFALLGAFFASRSAWQACVWTLSALFILMKIPALASLLLLGGSTWTFVSWTRGS